MDPPRKITFAYHLFAQNPSTKNFGKSAKLKKLGVFILIFTLA